MPDVTRKERQSIAVEFHAYMQQKSCIGKSLERKATKNGEYKEFQQKRKEKDEKNVNFSSVLYMMREIGLANYTKVRITLFEQVTLQKKRSNIVIDAMVVEKRKMRSLNENSKEQDVRQQIMNHANLQNGHGSGGIEVSCKPPAVKNDSDVFVEFTMKAYDKSDGAKANVQKMTLSVKNSTASTCSILRCHILSKRSELQISESVSSSNIRAIKPGQEFPFEIICSTGKTVGACKTELMIQFESVDSGQKRISTNVYFVRFEMCDQLIERLQPKQPYTRPVAAVSQTPSAEIVRGERPPSSRTDKLKRKIPLPEYPVPNYVKNALKDGAFVQDADRPVTGYKKTRQLLENPVTMESYAERFHLLLHLEELQNLVDIRRYDMSSVKMAKEGRMMFLRVPGLAEKRPSVLRGDRIFVTMQGENEVKETVEYEGFVNHVEMERVALGFSQKLLSKHTKKAKYNVRFTFNRLPMRLAHRALTILPSRQVIFPKECECLYSDIKIRKSEFKNPRIENNPEQMQAVNHIVRGKYDSVPYIVFGPPGTGKTVTIVEAIHQIIHIYECCHVLVCAPSNSACDHITKLLSTRIRAESIFRMHAASRSLKEVPAEIRHVSNYKDGDFYFPSKKDLSEYEVIVCTLITAGRLASADFPDDHFTHVFIDEAGQATEPDCIIPLAGVLALGGQVVLAGDPKQLGPVVRSSAARHFGLGVSYLERLMETELLYQKDKDLAYNPFYITKLLNNYRSHHSILKVPNACFYENELRYAADSTELMTKWSHLPQPGFPMIFEGVVGEDLRESTSPSFYNPHEISVLVKYVEKVLEYGIAGRDIGVIAPYRKQVQKIKQELLNRDIKVGSVEEFQGQERDVIIISAVRSDSKYLSFDAKHNLGFLTDPKRFNVAVTRAKALLVVIGNPHILGLNYHWKMLLEYCIEKHGYRGVAYDRDEKRGVDIDEIEEILRDMTDMQIQ